MPSAAIVLIAIGVATLFFRPLGLWNETFEQVIASMLYYENWYLAFNSVDYLAADQSRSPLQHFWAMSIQGHFYLIWLAVFLIAGAVARKSQLPAVRVASGLIITISVLSFIWSVLQTSSNQQFAYFSTWTRAWEFGAGSLLALFIHRIRVPATLASLLSWFGLAILLLLGFVLPVADVFPGWIATLPVLAATFIMVAGESKGRWGADRFLGSKPLKWLGEFGYAFYLWHWPVMIFVLTVQQRVRVGFLTGVGILLTSFALAYLTRRFIEKPILNLRNAESTSVRRVATSAALSLALIVSIMGLGGQYLAATQTEAANEARWASLSAPCAGARALMNPDDCSADPNAPVTPANPDDDFGPVFNERCHTTPTGTELKKCEWGDRTGDTRVLLIGNSHAAVWTAPLDMIATANQWQLDSYNKASCSFSTTARNFENTAIRDSCTEWVQDLIDRLATEEPYDYIVTSAFALNTDFLVENNSQDSFEAGVEGYVNAWSSQIDRGTEIIVMRDYPHTTTDVLECSRINPAAECATRQNDVLVPVGEDAAAQAALSLDGATLVDMTYWFCLDGTCPTVVGNVYVYRDYHHFTETYGITLAEPLAQTLREQTSMPL